MIKAIIVDDNIEYSKNILNNVINKIEDIHITHIAVTGEEAINIISNNDIDLVFLDLKLPDYNGIDVIKKVNTLNNIKKINYIIISGELSLINKLMDNRSILTIIKKLDSNESIFKKICNAIHTLNYIENEKVIRKFIFSEISNMGYNIKHKGTKYIIESINYIYESNNMDLLDNLERNVYVYIAYKYKKSINNIKTNIIRATNYIPTNNSLEKYTPKSVISSILVKLA